MEIAKELEMLQVVYTDFSFTRNNNYPLATGKPNQKGIFINQSDHYAVVIVKP